MAKGTSDPRYRNLIAALCEARRAAGFNQTELAEQLGKRQQFVSKYESGERRLDVIEFIDIATVLKMNWPAVLTAEAVRD